jgi:hypothetical protein
MMWEDVDIMSVTQQNVFLRSDYIMVIPCGLSLRPNFFRS